MRRGEYGGREGGRAGLNLTVNDRTPFLPPLLPQQQLRSRRPFALAGSVPWRKHTNRKTATVRDWQKVPVKLSNKCGFAEYLTQRSFVRR